MAGKTRTIHDNTVLLCPVPKDHMDSGLDAFKSKGEVWFGSEKKTLLGDDKLAEDLIGLPVYIWVSGCDKRFLYRARFVGWVNWNISERQKDFRPKTAWGNDGKWKGYWRVSGLEPLPEAEPVTSFGPNTEPSSPYSPDFAPHGPIVARCLRG